MSNPQWIELGNDRLLAVTGPDREKFLQGQTTTDFRDVTAGHSRLGCVCNLKGRAIFSYRAVEWRETIWLLLDGGLFERARLHLQKYIIFSKAALDAPPVKAFGLVGANAGALLQQVTGLLPDATDAVRTAADWAVVRLGDERFLILAADTPAAAALCQSVAERCRPGVVEDWRLAQIRAGEVQILAEAAEIFQPQEINFPALNGVSYNKGCYTGQEIVARLYFRGKLKQWAHRFRAPLATTPAPNAPLLNADGATAGHVIMAARDGDHVELLAVVRHDAREGLTLDGAPLEALGLPYAIEPRE